MDRYPYSAMIVTVGGSTEAAYATLHGDVDLNGEVDLIYAAAQLAALASRQVILDLTDVAFADASLLTFIVRVYLVMPAGIRLTLYRPTLQVRRMIHLTELDTIAPISEQLPGSIGSSWRQTLHMWSNTDISSVDGRPALLP